MREILHNKIKDKKLEILSLKDDIKQLYREDCLLCDDKQWYSESDEEYFISKRPKKIGIRKIGRVHWVDTVKDDDSNRILNIELSKVVKVDGKWI